MALVKHASLAAMLLVAVSSIALAQSSGGGGSAGGTSGGSSTGPATGGGAPGVAAPGTSAAPGSSGSLGSVGTTAGSNGTAGSGTAATTGGSAQDTLPPGAAPNGTQLTEGTVRQALEAQGFSQVQNVRRTQNGFVALAMKNGQSHRVGIDQNGRVVMMN